MMEVRTWIGGRRAVGLPFTDECQPLLADHFEKPSLLEMLKCHPRFPLWRSVELRGGQEWMHNAPASVEFYTHELDLTGGEDRLFEGLDGSLRRGIRKAEKNGVTIQIERTLDATKQFYRLYCLTRRRHGLPPQAFRFFANIHEEIFERGLGFVVQAFSRGASIASAVFFTMGKRAIYKYGASDMSSQGLRGNTLVFWEAIRCLAQRGFETLSMGRTSLHNEGLRRFKLNWGAQESVLRYFRYDVRQGKIIPLSDQSHGWHNRVFNLMPLWTARLIGRMLYRQAA